MPPIEANVVEALISFIRVALMVYASWLFFRRKRALGCAGFLMLAMATFPYALLRTDVEVPIWMFTYTNIIATPAIACLVGAAMTWRDRYDDDRWRL